MVNEPNCFSNTKTIWYIEKQSKYVADWADNIVCVELNCFRYFNTLSYFWLILPHSLWKLENHWHNHKTRILKSIYTQLTIKLQVESMTPNYQKIITHLNLIWLITFYPQGWWTIVRKLLTETFLLLESLVGASTVVSL